MNDKQTNRDKDTIEILQVLKETPPRDPDQAARGRKAFLAQAEQISAQPVSIPLFQRLIDSFTKPRIQMRFSTLTIGLILGVLFLTFTSSAVAARQSKPDQVLYPFKLWLENSRLSLTTQTEEKINLHLIFAEERLEELNTQGQTYSPSGIERAVNNLSSHLEAVRSIMGEDQDENGRRERLNSIEDQYKEFEHDEEDEEKLEQDEDRAEDDSENLEYEGEDTEDKPEETESPEDQDEREDSDDSKHGKDSGEDHHAGETEEPSDDDDEPESTEEPDNNSGSGSDDGSDDGSEDSSGSSEDDPTKTPEPTDDD